MENFPNMLKYLRKRENLSQDELAGKIGVSPSTVGMYEQGRREPDFETEEKLADLFNVSLDTLRGKDSESRSHKNTIPVYGRVAAGIPIEAIEDVIDTEEISEEMSQKGEYFGVKIKGDSMLPDIHDGDYVIVRRQSDAESGQIVVARVNGNEGCCKKLVKYSGMISLVSLNAKYDPMNFTDEEIRTKPIEIVGIVVELRRKFSM